MKFMSDFKELEGKIFNSINECKDAESVILKEREALAEKEKDKSKLKKRLSGEIEKAETALQEAYTKYDEAKEAARVILEESNKQIMDILTPAKEQVNKAEKAKAEAIKNFNKECGPYQKVYTGEQAQIELDRFNKQFNNIFNNFIKDFLF